MSRQSAWDKAGEGVRRLEGYAVCHQNSFGELKPTETLHLSCTWDSKELIGDRRRCLYPVRGLKVNSNATLFSH